MDNVPVEDLVACFVTRDKWMLAYPQLKYVCAYVMQTLNLTIGYRDNVYITFIAIYLYGFAYLCPCQR